MVFWISRGDMVVYELSKVYDFLVFIMVFFEDFMVKEEIFFFENRDVNICYYLF